MILFVENLVSVIETLLNGGNVKVLCNKAGKITHLCFARHEQQEIFHRYPHVVNVDATHGTNNQK